MKHLTIRSADIARFRLGLRGAPYRIDRTDRQARLARYRERRDLHLATGQPPALEIWRSS